jgi:hypothetical protein
MPGSLEAWKVEEWKLEDGRLAGEDRLRGQESSNLPVFHSSSPTWQQN